MAGSASHPSRAASQPLLSISAAPVMKVIDYLGTWEQESYGSFVWAVAESKIFRFLFSYLV